MSARDARLVVDALQRPTISTDADGRVAIANAAARALFGDELEGRELGSLFDRSGPLVRAAMAEALNGRVWRGDVPIDANRQGRLPEPVSLHVIVSPLNERGAAVGVVVSAEDVTESREAERHALELMDRLSLALEAGDLGTWKWDKASGTVDWDERLERIFGLEPGTFGGTFDDYVALLHPDEREEILAQLDAAQADRSGYELEHRVVWPDGTVHWLHGRGIVTTSPAGEVSGTIGCVVDVTARKWHEAEAVQRAGLAALAADIERAEREHLEFLIALSDAAINAADHRSYLDVAAATCVPTLGDWCQIVFVPESTVELPVMAIAHHEPTRASEVRQHLERRPFDPGATSGAAAVMRSRSIEVFDELDPSNLPPTLAELDGLALSCVITLPLITSRGVRGVLRAASESDRPRRSGADTALARAAASRIAEGLDDLWRADQQRHIAATLQAALLPPALPTIDGIDVVARYWAAGASEVGGDFYDVFAIDEGAWSIVIGDVCGTGPDAAAVTSIARHTIRAAARHGHEHKSVVDWLNQAVLLSGRGLFTTACYATLERAPTGWELTSVAAGHPLPIVVRLDGEVEVVGMPGTLLGVFDQIKSHPARTTLHAGDTVIFYTDGVTDLPAPYGMTEDELAAVAKTAADLRTADDVADELRRAISERAPIAQRSDDIALVIVRIA